MPLASLPTQISGRNRVWRRLIIDAIRNDPAWQGGEYHAQPPALRTAIEMIWLVGSNPPLRQQEAPTLVKADEVIDAYVAHGMQVDDANDLLYQVAASHDYDPGPGLEKIEAPLLAVNSADDLVNPPELGILEQEIKRVPTGPGDRHSLQHRDPRPRLAHLRGAVEAVPGGAAQVAGTLKPRAALKRAAPARD